MLNNADKTKSFDNVKSFVESLGGYADSFNGIFDVIVEKNGSYLYRDIEVSTYYQYGYMDYKIEIMWEYDKNQVDYQQLGLHGQYTTNFQLFFFTDKNLTFYDGASKICIIPK